MTEHTKCPNCNLELITTLLTKEATKVRAQNWMTIHILECDGVVPLLSFKEGECPVCEDRKCNHTEGLGVLITIRCLNCHLDWKLDFYVGYGRMEKIGRKL